MAKVAIDAPAPDFSLAAFTGQPITLSEFRGQSNVLLVFNRSFL